MAACASFFLCSYAVAHRRERLLEVFRKDQQLDSGHVKPTKGFEEKPAQKWYKSEGLSKNHANDADPSIVWGAEGLWLGMLCAN